MTGTSLRRRAKRVDQPSELPSMHLVLPRETPKAFRGTPTTVKTPSYRHPRVTVHALGTASRNAEGVSRHPNTRIDPELQASPSYRPCTWHCLEKRRRRFSSVSRHLNTRIVGELQATATYRFPQQALMSHIPAT